MAKEVTPRLGAAGTGNCLRREEAGASSRVLHELFQALCTLVR